MAIEYRGFDARIHEQYSCEIEQYGVIRRQHHAHGQLASLSGNFWPFGRRLTVLSLDF
jgi:hypothetical protein